MDKREHDGGRAAGRKPAASPSIAVKLMINEEDKAVLQLAAKALGMPVATYCRVAALKQARRDLTTQSNPTE
jgi:hypothetical protein